MDLNPNNLIRSNSSEESLSVPKRCDSGKDDDDPLSIRGKSISFLGLILALMTIVLPTTSVLIERPLLQDFGETSNQRLEKDGY